MSYLKGMPIEYASLYLEGTPLTEMIPEYLQDDWRDVSKQLEAFHRSLQTAQVDQLENCFFDLVPDRFLIDLCQIKNEITSYIFKNYKRPSRYGFYECVAFMLESIRSRPVSIDHRILTSFAENPKLKNQCLSIASGSGRVNYRQFGTVTGRLTTEPNSFPVLTLNKDLRTAILPTNDFFVEMDFNGAEVRTLLGVLGKEQPLEDVHDFHRTEVFQDKLTREQSKVAFFAWLYGSSQVDAAAKKTLESFYNRELLLKKYWDGTKVKTPYGKVITTTSRHHALNYLIQSTAAELTLKQALKLEEALKRWAPGSHLAFLIHDAVVLDLKKEDLHLLATLVNLMGSTNFGTFGVNIKKGTTLGNLKDCTLG